MICLGAETMGNCTYHLNDFISFFLSFLPSLPVAASPSGSFGGISTVAIPRLGPGFTLDPKMCFRKKTKKVCQTSHQVFQFKRFPLKQKNKFLRLLQICQCRVWCRNHSRPKCSSNIFCSLIAAMQPVFSVKVWTMISSPPPMKIGLQHECQPKDDLP